MDLPNQILLYLLLVTAGQGLALSAILGLQPRSHPSTRCLWLFFTLLSLGCLEKSVEGIFFTQTGAELPFPLSFPLAYYPAIYLHIRYLANPQQQLRPVDAFLFVPAALFDFASFYLIEWQGNPTPLAIIPRSFIHPFELVYSLIFVAQFIAYTTAIQRIRSSLASAKTAPNDPRSAWIQNLFRILIVFWASWVLVRLIGKANPIGYLSSFVIHGAVIALIYGIGYRFILKERKPLERQLALSQNHDPSTTSALLVDLRQRALHRSPSLTLADAAKQLGCSQKRLSSAIASTTHPNFTDFINDLRIDEFKQLAAQPTSQKLSLLGIAQAAGFSSKSSFHRIFKTRCGQTPGEYLNSLPPAAPSPQTAQPTVPN